MHKSKSASGVNYMYMWYVESTATGSGTWQNVLPFPCWCYYTSLDCHGNGEKASSAAHMTEKRGREGKRKEERAEMS